MHNHKDKLNKDTNDDTFGPMQKSVTIEDHIFVTSYLYVINKRDQRTHKQGNIDPNKQTQGIKNPYKKKLENRNS